MAAKAFGYKMAWVAARSTDPEAVLAALGADGVEPAAWEDGIAAVYGADPLGGRYPAFATPSLDGWSLVASPAFFEEASDVEPERLGRFVAELSARLDTEVQLFVTHRVVEGHAWAKATSGALERAFYYLGEIGEVLLDEPSPTPVEVPGREPDEEAVMAVAGAWSLDPTALEERFPDAAGGFMCSIAGRAGHASGADPAAADGADPAPGTDPAPGPASDPGRPPRRPWWKLW